MERCVVSRWFLWCLSPSSRLRRAGGGRGRSRAMFSAPIPLVPTRTRPDSTAASMWQDQPGSPSAPPQAELSRLRAWCRTRVARSRSRSTATRCRSPTSESSRPSRAPPCRREMSSVRRGTAESPSGQRRMCTSGSGCRAQRMATSTRRLSCRHVRWYPLRRPSRRPRPRSRFPHRRRPSLRPR